MRYGTAEVYEQIVEKINRGVYTPGTQMVEADLALEYNVSRNTIKKVLLMLEGKGYVTIEANKGARVRSFTHTEIREMMQVREVLESMIVQQAVPRLTDEQIEQMDAILRQMQDHLSAGELLRYSECNRQFHQIIYSACPNRTAVSMLLDLREQISKYNIKTILITGRGQQSFSEHRAILDAIRRRDAEAASALMREHISGVEKTMQAYQEFTV